MTDEPTKICNGALCKGKIVPLSICRNKKENLTRYCGECMKIKAKEEYQIRLKKEHLYPDFRECPICEENKPIGAFNLKCGTEREHICGTCRNAKRDPEKRKAQRKNWIENGGGDEWIKQYQESYKGKRNKDNKIRNKTDIDYHIKKIVRGRIIEILKRNNLSRNHKNKYLGIKIWIYRKWIESQFTDGMTWKNHGTYWQIDHVMPCAAFKFESDNDDAIYECFGWKNTRPLLRKDNLAKKDKIDYDAITRQSINVQLFIFKNPSYKLGSDAASIKEKMIRDLNKVI